MQKINIICIGKIKEKYFADHVHPADAGHQVIANKLKRFLENM